jgi:hypothetical protein
MAKKKLAAPAKISDLEFMKDPTKWPMWPFLPLKNRGLRQASPDRPSVGLLTESGFLLGANLFDRESVAKANPQTITPEQLIALGWEVD